MGALSLIGLIAGGIVIVKFLITKLYYYDWEKVQRITSKNKRLLHKYQIKTKAIKFLLSKFKKNPKETLLILKYLEELEELYREAIGEKVAKKVK